VHAEYLSVDDSGKGEIVKNFGAITPYGDGSVLPEALVVESVDLRDLSRLVVASYQHDAIRISDFEGEEEEKRFNTVESSVDKVSQEEVIGFRDIATNFEKFFGWISRSAG
jgi:hypothetical protein